MILFLVGYMGSGKTKTAKALARKSAYDFLDTDEMIEELQQKSIADIFAESGENAFREMERVAIRTLKGKNNLIVATGGGLPCFHENMKWMNQNGTTVYLKVPQGMLVQRLKNNRMNRPLIQSLDEQRISEKVGNDLMHRERFYSEASIVFDAGHFQIGKLMNVLRENGILIN